MEYQFTHKREYKRTNKYWINFGIVAINVNWVKPVYVSNYNVGV